MNEAQEILARLEQLEGKVDAVFRSAEKTRKYFLATLVVTVLTVVLPLLGMALLVPYYLSTLNVQDLLI